MNHLFLITAIITLGLPNLVAAGNYGLGVVIDDPAYYYGEVDVRAVPDPWLVYEQPVTIETTAATANVAPIYLYVPGDHHRRWFKHCHEYDACDIPVYFVKENWYKKVYVPAYYSNRGKATAHPVLIPYGHYRRY